MLQEGIDQLARKLPGDLVRIAREMRCFPEDLRQIDDLFKTQLTAFAPVRGVVPKPASGKALGYGLRFPHLPPAPDTVWNELARLIGLFRLLGWGASISAWGWEGSHAL